MDNLFADLTDQHLGVSKRLNKILTNKEIAHLVTLRQCIGLATDIDLDTKESVDEAVFFLRGYAESLGIEYLRGILTGILLCLETDSREKSLVFGRLHYEMIPFYEAVYSMMLEKSASDL